MSEKQHTDRQQTIETLRKLIDEIEIAMLTTVTESNSLRSRPMITARHEFDGDLWFFTMLDDPKVAEIKSHPQVNVTYASPNNDRYVSLTGSAEVVTDRKRIETLWNEDARDWFPDGAEQQNLALLRIDVAEAEYWDHKAGRLGGVVKSLFKGDENGGKHEHQKIKWDEAVSVT